MFRTALDTRIGDSKILLKDYLARTITPTHADKLYEIITKDISRHRNDKSANYLDARVSRQGLNLGEEIFEAESLCSDTLSKLRQVHDSNVELMNESE